MIRRWVGRSTVILAEGLGNIHDSFFQIGVGGSKALLHIAKEKYCCRQVFGNMHGSTLYICRFKTEWVGNICSAGKCCLVEWKAGRSSHFWNCGSYDDFIICCSFGGHVFSCHSVNTWVCQETLWRCVRLILARYVLLIFWFFGAALWARLDVCLIFGIAVLATIFIVCYRLIVLQVFFFLFFL